MDLLKFLMFFVVHLSRGEYTCEPNWKLVGDTCVLVNEKEDDRTSWHVARDKCHNMNASLVTIRSAEKQKLLLPFIASDSWVDLFRDSSSDEFLWANGPATVNYTNWQNGQPNNGGEGCAILMTGRANGGWNDVSCFTKYHFICETVAGTNGCPSHMSQLAGRCYSFSGSAATWYDARKACQRNSTDLAVFKSKKRSDLFYSSIAKDVNRNRWAHWIGATDVHEEGVWKWLDEPEEMEFQNWSEGAPNNGQNGLLDCVYMSGLSSIGTWKTQHCQVFYRPLCEKPVSNVRSCDGGWIKYKYDTCLSAQDELSSWSEARRTCQGLGGDLVKIEDEEKVRFIRRILTGNKLVWIGLHDPGKNGTWRWLDSRDEVSYFDWSRQYPFGHYEGAGFNCVFMRSSVTAKGRWANSLCSKHYAYICELFSDGNCQPGWLPFDRDCYKFNYDITTWQNARARCRMQNPNSDLVRVENFMKQFWVQVNAVNLGDSTDVSGFWIGLNSLPKRNHFVWLNDTRQTGYTNWDARMPSYHVDEACVAAKGSTPGKGEWKDEACEEKKDYICEKPAEGDATYYDFRYNQSVYKIFATQFSKEHGADVCRKILGDNSTLMMIDGADELEFVTREMEVRGFSFENSYWLDGISNKTYEKSITTRKPSSYYLKDEDEYGERHCLQLWFQKYMIVPEQFRPRLQARQCCIESSLICEKHIDKNLVNKYDFALNTTIYRLVDNELLDRDSANRKCAEMLDNSGNLLKFETWQEVAAVSAEVLSRHRGEHFVYWVDVDADKLNWHKADTDSKCASLDFDPTKSMHFNATMTLKVSDCGEKKKFLCEQKGVHIYVQNFLDSIIQWKSENANLINQKPPNSNSVCTGPCIGLAVALPFVAIGSVLATIAYFWFIKRQSPVPVRFRNEDESVFLTT